MSSNTNRPMSQIEMVAAAEKELATARAVMREPPTAATATTITSALNRASDLIWAITQERRDLTASNTRTRASAMPEGRDNHAY
jgi:hypothetical protein